MNTIIGKHKIAGNIISIDVEAQYIVSGYKPGLLVDLQITSDTRPFRMVVSRVNEMQGTLTLFVNNECNEQRKLASLSVGDSLFSIKGIWAFTSEINKLGTVVCVAQQGGVDLLFPVIESLKKKGNKVVVILNNNGEKPQLESDICRSVDQLISISSGGVDSGAEMYSVLNDLFCRDKIDKLFAFGPIELISQSTKLARRYGFAFDALLCSEEEILGNFPRVYRVSLCNSSRFICVDGENFNAYYPDFTTMAQRMNLPIANSNVSEYNYFVPHFVDF